MKAIIIDNEINIITGLKALLATYAPKVEVIGTAQDIDKGEELIRSLQPDILFLDIELDDATGIDLIKRFDAPEFQLIFITAYNQYAIEAFKYSAVDYLLKPIDPDDLIQAVTRAEDIIQQKDDRLRLQVLINNLQNISKSDRKMIITDRENVYAVDVQSILYLQADGPYTRIKRINDFIFASKNLKYYESLLQFAGFYRVHHSYVANLRHMKRFDKVENELELNNGDRIPVSVRKREGLINAIKGQTLI